MFQLFETTPYPVAFFTPDGRAAYINPVLCEYLNVADFNEIAEKYNIMEDKHILDTVGLREFAEKVLSGQTARALDIKMPFARAPLFTRKDEQLEEIFRLNLTGFPLLDENKKIKYIFCMAHRTATYTGKKEVIRAKEYIDEHLLMDYNAKRIACSSEISVRHLDRMFKESTGETPYNYYKRMKIEGIKQALADPNLTVEQAFESCCVDYNGTYAHEFKEITGLSPLEYKKKLTVK